MPIAFSAITRASLFGIVGSPIASTTLATITCADGGMTIRLSEPVPGLTFSYAAGVLSVAGTPATPTGVHRVVVSYIASDGSNEVRGSTTHTITVVSASEVLTIGGMGGASGKVGAYLSAALALPSTNYAVDVTITGRNAVPGCAPQLSWTKGVGSASGTLSLDGTPTTTGSYSLVVDYWAGGGILLGTSTHAVEIAPAYSAPAPAPSPVPAPPAPAPSPPPEPAPAPAPGTGPDPFFSSVKVLMGFDTITGVGYDPAVGPPGVNENLRGTSAVMRNVAATSNGGAFGYVGQVKRPGGNPGIRYTAAFASNSASSMVIPGAAGISGKADSPLAAECFVDIDEAAYAALVAPGTDFRWCPVVHVRRTDGVVVWALGFFSIWNQVGAVGYRTVRAGLYMLVSKNSGANPWPSVSTAFGPIINARPGRFAHMAGGVRFYPDGGSPSQWDMISGCWFDGLSGGIGGDIRAKSSLAPLPEPESALSVHIGGSAGLMLGFNTGSPATLIPFTGAIDELRITAAGRFDDYIGFSQVYGLPADKRVIPWPNY